MEKYDSSKDTIAHIREVRERINYFINELCLQSHMHDDSKLKEPEKQIFDEYTPKLKELTYGSEEYKNCLKSMNTALEHHYTENRHHPEHFKNGIMDMDLIDIIEMFCDWKAATLRHKDGDIYKSIKINQQRFNFHPEFAELLIRTAKRLGW